MPTPFRDAPWAILVFFSLEDVGRSLAILADLGYRYFFPSGQHDPRYPLPAIPRPARPVPAPVRPPLPGRRGPQGVFRTHWIWDRVMAADQGPRPAHMAGVPVRTRSVDVCFDVGPIRPCATTPSSMRTPALSLSSCPAPSDLFPLGS